MITGVVNFVRCKGVRPPLSALVAIGVLAAFALSAPLMARMHTALTSATPAKGEVIAASPITMRLVFSGPVEGALGRISITSATKSIKLTVRADPRDANAMLADLVPTETGTHRVDWHVLSADGHPVTGTYSFTVRGTTQPPGATDTASPSPDAGASAVAAPEGDAVAGSAGDTMPLPFLPPILRALAALFTLGTAGLLAFRAWFAPQPRGAPTRVSESMLATAALVFCIAHAWTWAVYATDNAGTDAAVAALMTDAGRAELFRAAFAALTVVAVALVKRPGLAVWPAWGAVAATAFIGHAAAMSPALLLPLKALHLAAAALWGGGLLLLIASQPDSSQNPRAVSDAALTLRVSAVALGSVIVVAVTGVAQTLLLTGVTAILTSTYGLLALAKAAALAVLVCLGAFNRLRNVPAVVRGETIAALRRVVAWEIVVMVVAFLIAGFLAYTPPPADAARQTMTPSTATAP